MGKMKNYAIGIDIADKSIKAVKVERSLFTGRMRLVALEERSWEKVTELPSFIEHILNGEPFQSGKVHLNFPAHECYYLKVHLPFSSRKKVGQIICFEIESRVPFRLADFNMDFQVFPEDEGGGEVLVALTAKSMAAQYGRCLSSTGHRGEFIDISGLSSFYLVRHMHVSSWVLLQINASTIYLFFNCAGHLAEIRTFHRGEEKNHLFAQIKTALDVGEVRYSQKREYHVFLSGEGASDRNFVAELSHALNRNFIHLDLLKSLEVELDEKLIAKWQPGKFNEALALSCRGLVSSPKGFSLAYEPQKSFGTRSFQTSGRWWAAGVLVVLLLGLFESVLEYTTIRTRINRIGQEMQRVYRTLAPNAGYAKDPVKEVELKVREERKALSALRNLSSFPTFVEVLGDISRAIPIDCQLVIQTMNYDPPKIIMNALVKDLMAVDKVKQALIGVPLFQGVKVEIQGQGEGKEKPNVMITIELREL